MRRLALATASLALAGLAAAAPAAMAFEGRWKAGSSAYEQTITIRKAAGGTYSGDFSVGIRGCGGDLKATGRAEGERLTFAPATTEDPGEAACRVTADRKGGRLEVSEERCLMFHGAACEFSGTYRRIGR